MSCPNARKRVVLSAPTVRERLADTKEIMAVLLKELQARAYVEPVDVIEPVVVIKMDLSANMAIYEAVDYFLEVFHSSLKKAPGVPTKAVRMPFVDS